MKLLRRSIVFRSRTHANPAKKITVLLFFALTLAYGPARAEIVSHGFVLEASTAGLGADYVIGFGDHLQIRAGGNAFNFSYSVDGSSAATAGELDYDGDLKLRSAGPTIDWYPTGNSFRISIGFHWNDNRIQNRATCNDPSGDCDMGFSVFDRATLGTITADIDFATFAPYIGIGLGNPLKQEGFSCLLDVGVMYQGSPKVSLSSDGSCSSNPLCREALEREEREVQEDLKPFRFFPVINLAMGYRF